MPSIALEQYFYDFILIKVFNVAFDFKILQMKKLLHVISLVAIFAIIAPETYSQLRKIPAEVTTSFTKKYPDATAVEWRDKLSSFTASFTLDSITYVASFDSNGQWENTEQVIDKDDLPLEVQNGFQKSRYSDWDVALVNKIELANDEVQYRVEVGKGDIKRRNLYFDSTGKMLKDRLTL